MVPQAIIVRTVTGAIPPPKGHTRGGGFLYGCHAFPGNRAPPSPSGFPPPSIRSHRGQVVQFTRPEAGSMHPAIRAGSPSMPRVVNRSLSRAASSRDALDLGGLVGDNVFDES